MINFENQKPYNMETIRIQFQPNIKEKIMSFLESLPKKEVEIIIEDSQFEKDIAEVQRQYNEFKNGNCKVYSIEEVEEMIENGML
jgi:nitrogen regulatory protein PII